MTASGEKRQRQAPPRLGIAGAELLWAGKHAAAARDTPSPALAVRERFEAPTPPDAFRNRLYAGDNLDAMEALLAEFAGRVDLIYADPPFNAGKRWTHEAAIGNGRFRLSPDRADRRVDSYGDTWGRGGEGYLAMLHARFVLMRELLAPTGSLYVHVDYRAHPYVRLMLEELFGPDNLVNDIVWAYRSGGGTARRFGMKHDNILLFAKSHDYKFNADAVRVPYDAVIAEKRRDAFHPGGKVCSDVWDISRPPNHSAEWIGYATQKPEAVVERALLASSDAGDLVADFFCGAGTTMAVAERLGKRWLACDAGHAAIAASRKRIALAHRRLAQEGRAFRGADILSSDEMTTGGAALDVAVEPRGGGMLRVQLRGWKSDAGEGLELLDYWAGDAGGSEDEPFTHRWCDFRTPRKREMVLAADVPRAASPIRVLACDIHGNSIVRTVAGE